MNEPKKIRIPLGVLVAILLVIIVVIIIVVGWLLTRKRADKTQIETSQSQEKNETTKEPIKMVDENKTNTDTITSMDNLKKDAIFFMKIEEIFPYTSGEYQSSVLGTIEKGTIKPNDTIQIINENKEIKTTTVGDLQLFRKQLKSATTGERVDIMLKDVKREEIGKGGVVVKLKENLPDTIPNKTEFEADIHMLKTEEGGRYTPFYSNYEAKFNFATMEFTGKIQLKDEIEKVSPGEDAHVSILLNSRTVLEVGTKFTIYEGTKIIANGTVSKIKEL